MSKQLNPIPIVLNEYLVKLSELNDKFPHVLPN